MAFAQGFPAPVRTAAASELTGSPRLAVGSRRAPLASTGGFC